ncbi:hypothetical protein [Paenibacillus sp. FSL H7-0714]|uniref:hypothetical protein n=1 Tax=Paenibacillus sp. FSL H7-0714 TaxID=2954735 RepID=UPI004046A96A
MVPEIELPGHTISIPTAYPQYSYSLKLKDTTKNGLLFFLMNIYSNDFGNFSIQFSYNCIFLLYLCVILNNSVTIMMGFC